MYRRIVVFLACIFTCPALAADDEATYNIQVENDLFASGADRHYTNGIRLSYLTKAKPCGPDSQCLSGILKDLTAFIPSFRDGESYRVSYSLGQNMYTPADISVAELQPNDRPYAGWLYGGLGFVTRNTFGNGHGHSADRIDNLELNVGVIGPLSGAEFAQKNWHKLFNFRRPRGWDNQLKNEPGIVLQYERIWQFRKSPAFAPRLDVELAPSVGAAAGNVFTHAAAGLRARLGIDLPEDYGPPRIRPSLPGSDYFVPKERHLGFYAFAGVEGRAVLRNIFLDGNTFRKSHSVDKKNFVGDITLGAAIITPRYGFLPPSRISYTYIFRSKEFAGQTLNDKFGSINLSFNL